MATKRTKHFISLGLFLLDEFEFLDSEGKPTQKFQPVQIGGGTYTTIGARIWLPSSAVGQIVDRGTDFPAWVQQELDHYGAEVWHFRDQATLQTARAMNRYRGDLRDFDYLTPRIRLTPKDLCGTPLELASQVHFVCSPARASQIMYDFDNYGADRWAPFTIYEPIPISCVPGELPALKRILAQIDVLSPNAEEALGLLSIDKTKESHPLVIEQAAATFLSFGVGRENSGHVIIRCGSLGAYGATMVAGAVEGWWIPAYWTPKDDSAGNSFLGGLSAGLHAANGNMREAVMYATVSAGYTIQQTGLPKIEYKCDPASGKTLELWNGDLPKDRLARLKSRLNQITRLQGGN